MKLHSPNLEYRVLRWMKDCRYSGGCCRQSAFTAQVNLRGALRVKPSPTAHCMSHVAQKVPGCALFLTCDVRTGMRRITIPTPTWLIADWMADCRSWTLKCTLDPEYEPLFSLLTYP